LRHIGLSRLARYASAKGIEPEEINDATIDGFITAVRDGSLHHPPRRKICDQLGPRRAQWHPGRALDRLQSADLHGGHEVGSDVAEGLADQTRGDRVDRSELGADRRQIERDADDYSWGVFPNYCKLLTHSDNL
jgi:hypothetical protein